ncbi:MAG: hypothetical protein ABIH42_05565 [Planctomycetota bacterium]
MAAVEEAAAPGRVSLENVIQVAAVNPAVVAEAVTPVDVILVVLTRETVHHRRIYHAVHLKMSMKRLNHRSHSSSLIVLQYRQR